MVDNQTLTIITLTDHNFKTHKRGVETFRMGRNTKLHRTLFKE